MPISIFLSRGLLSHLLMQLLNKVFKLKPTSLHRSSSPREESKSLVCRSLIWLVLCIVHTASKILIIIDSKLMRVKILKIGHFHKRIIIKHRSKAKWSKKLIKYSLLVVCSLLGLIDRNVLLNSYLLIIAWPSLSYYSNLTSSVYWLGVLLYLVLFLILLIVYKKWGFISEEVIKEIS